MKKKASRAIHKLGETVINGMQQQNSKPDINVILRLPHCLLSQPAIGIDTSAPKAIISSSVPNVLLLIEKNSFSSGNLATQLAYRKPFTKKKTEVAILYLTLSVIDNLRCCLCMQ